MFVKHSYFPKGAQLISARLRVQQKATRHDQRHQNLRLVLQCIVADGSISRADVSRATGLTPATVSHLVAQLEDDGLVAELGTGPSAGGKPPTLYGLNAGARSIVAIDLSDGKRVGSIFDLEGNPTGHAETSRNNVTGEAAVKHLCDVIDGLVKQSTAPLLGIGIGTPGVIDDDGTVIEASYLDWHGVPLRSLVADRYDLPVHVINNSRAAAIAEYSFGDHEAENLLVIKVGNGVGAGVLLDGRIHGGEDSAAGEIGHVVVDPEGSPCYCGKVGCLETVVAAPRLNDAMVPLLDEVSTSVTKNLRAAGDLAIAGHDTALKVIDEATRYLAAVLSTTVAVLDIHKVVITGIVSGLGEPFLERLATAIEDTVLSTLASKLELCYGHTGDPAVRMGAAALVMNRELGVV